MRSLPANGAGARRNGPAFMKCRRSSAALSDGEALEIALIENIQRADLNALEEARGYSQLMSQFTLYPTAARRFAWQEPQPYRQYAAPADTCRKACADISKAGGSPPGMRAPWWRPRSRNARRRASSKWASSVSQAEDLSRESARPQSARPAKAAPEKSADIKALEKHLTEQLGPHSRDQRSRCRPAGEVTIHYKTLEQLDEICRRLAARRTDFNSP